MYVLTTFPANITIYSIIHKRTLSELGKRIFNPHAAMPNSLRTVLQILWVFRNLVEKWFV